MIRLLCFVLAVMASAFKSRLRLEAENAALRRRSARRRTHRARVEPGQTRATPGWSSPSRQRCCRKNPKLLYGKFLAERQNTLRLLVDMPSGQLPKSLASSSLYDASPHTIVGSPHLQLGKFAFSDAKRLFRQHRSDSEKLGLSKTSPHYPEQRT
jgi:hypothetical protein